MFDFAVHISSISGNETLDQEYDRYVSLSVIEFEQAYVTVNGKLIYTMPENYLDLEICKPGRFDNYT
jgi:hypothetical protein